MEKEVERLASKMLEEANFEVVSLKDTHLREEWEFKDIPTFIAINKHHVTFFVDILYNNLDEKRLKGLLDFWPDTKLIYVDKKSKTFQTTKVKDYLKHKKMIPIQNDGFKIQNEIAEKYNKILQRKLT